MKPVHPEHLPTADESIPEWLRATLHVPCGHWETYAHRVRIAQERDVYDRYMAEHEEDWVKQLADWGFTWDYCHFSKGFGPTEEAWEHEIVRDYVKLCHRYGIKVCGYVGDTMIYGTFKNDYPDADDCHQKDEFGQPIYYGGLQTHRRRGCYNAPGWRAAMREIIRIGLQEVGLDGIVFDNLVYWPEPSQCRCHHCLEAFRAFLKAEYPSREAMMRRFGTSNVDHAVIPTFNPFQPPWTHDIIDDPLHQEWIRFKMRSTSDFLADLRAHIRSLNPEAIIANNCKGVNGVNSAYIRGIHIPTMVSLTDTYGAEEDYCAEYTEDGRLLSKIRTMRTCRVLGRLSHFHSCRHPRGKEAYPLNIAESLAFSNHGVGHTLNHGYHGKDDADFTEDVRRWIRFAREHADVFVQNETRHRVAVLHSTPSLAWNCRDPHLAVVTVEQALLLDDILFDPIDDAHLEQLDRWRVLVLPGCECMSDDQLDAVKAYLERGGNVLAIGDVALYDENRRLRPQMGLASLLGFSSGEAVAADPYAQEFTDLFGVHPSSPVRGAVALPPTMERRIGRGKLFYLSELLLATPRKLPDTKKYNVHYDVVDDRYLHAPRNRAEIIKALEELHEREIRLVAPEWVVTEITYPVRPGHEKEVQAHLLNYRLGTIVGRVTVEISLPEGAEVASVESLSPDRSQRRELEWEQRERTLRFVAGPLQVYELVTVTLR